jgi:hypothetical protein
MEIKVQQITCPDVNIQKSQHIDMQVLWAIKHKI